MSTTRWLWRRRFQPERLAADPALRRVRTQPAAVGWLIAIGLSGLTFAVWQRTPSAGSLSSAFLALGLDEDRARLVVAVAGAAVSAAVAALTGRTLASWLAASTWYALLFLPGFGAAALPQPLPGERVDSAAMFWGTLTLVGLGVAGAGLGGAAGLGVRQLAVAMYRFVGSSRRPWLAACAGSALLTVSALGVLRAPDVLTYGPWSGVLDVVDVAAGSYSQVTLSYHSATFGREMEAIVLLPPGYSTSNKRYPVIYLLHGTPGSDLDWARQGAAGILDSLLRAGRIPPTVGVLPSGVGPHGGSNDSWANDYVPGDLMETEFLHDLMPAIAARYRVLSDQAHTAIAGLSSGGYGAVNLALRHPGIFALALDFSGDVDPDPGTFGGLASERLANDPLVRAELTAPKDASAFYIGWAANDPYRAANLRLSQRLHASGYLVGTETVAGRHQWSAWRELLYDGLYRMGYLIGPARG